jgi:pimeloyl-ACP methyl ester carboxylesterase
MQPVDGPRGTVLRGPMYVHWEAPAQPASTAGPPWILVHGGGGQGTDYLTTPDGRLGWARLLVARGHTVFVVDRPGHGRSPHHPDVLGPLGPQVGLQTLQPIFLPEAGDDPGAAAHTQWPGGRTVGDPVLDQWLAPAGPMLADPAAMHALERDRLAELLDLVGPAVLVTHSAGGPGAWAAADARPDQVAALIAIETIGPPFLRRPQAGLDLAWGVTSVPLAFDPPVDSPAELELVTELREAELGAIPVTLQREGAVRRLAHLGRVPIAVVTGEASAFARFDRHLVAFLQQAGCSVSLVRLAEHGVRGNGHGIMLERNHEQALTVLTEWAAGVLR